MRPRDPKKDLDVRTAAQTEVTYASGELTVRTPKSGLLGRTGVVDVTVELPTGSRVDTTGAWTQVLGEGRLGETRVKTSSGDVRLDATGPLHLTASHGSITVDRVEGQAEITTSTGSLRVGLLDGPAVLENSHGTTTVGARDRRAAGEQRQRRHRGPPRRGLGDRHHRPRHRACG
ncbi:Putative adhesin domain-containing protein OS=Streptomyces glaucescens OX=1907 GN=SGLAU_17930 PE=4 SV=1 [Streptomyces glaucescens]